MESTTWTRIAIEGDDYFDVIEDYEEVKNKLEKCSGYAEFKAISGYKVTIRKLSIQAFYESGVEIMRSNWERIRELEDLRKSVTGWNEG